ncbi:MAG: hypothetical protein K0U40_11010 [Betaproteobacteria bacterium]|nr:hypothetical protein [Betaproteobacteria bacterium]
MKTIFTLASGRSGTSYLAHFFKHNVQDCYSTHEPYFTYRNPVLFGQAIAWNTYQEDEKLLPLLQRKKDFITRVNKPVYFESNHAFLKTCHRYAARLIDLPGFIHLVRDPRYVAKSELVREQLMRKIHFPFAYYKRRDKHLFQWSLTGDEAIFEYYKDIDISRYQFYLLQWIEIEYRATQLLINNNWQDKVFFIEVEKDLKNSSVLLEMLYFFGLMSFHKELKTNLKTNKTPFVGPTQLSEKDLHESEQIFFKLPQQYKSLFMRSPYKNCQWISAISGD